MMARDPRSVAAHALTLAGYSHEYAEKMVQAALDAYAHELAEQQRKWAKGRYGGVPALAVAENTVMMAANLIDPKREGRKPVHDLLDAYAHELAEQIRKDLSGADGGFYDGVHAAADLIDPGEKQ